MKGLRPFAAVATALVVLLINVALSVVYIAIYGMLINPGHPSQFYRDYAQVAAPYCSVVAGLPLMFFAGRFLARRAERWSAVRSTMLMWAAYAAVDLAFLVAGQRTLRLVVFTAISLTTKLLAAYAGATTARSSESRPGAVGV